MMGDPRMDLDDLPLGRIAISDWSYSRVLDRMLMYERRIENSVIKLMKELKRFQVMRRIELEGTKQQQPASEPSPPAENKDDLKKQSQFVPGENEAKSFTTGDYDKNDTGGVKENKANLIRPEPVERSQFHAAEPTEPAGKMEEPIAAATG